MLTSFALTVAPALNPRQQYKEDIDAIVARIKLKVPSMVVTDGVYELSSNGYLHYHANILMPKNTYLKRITNYPGWSVRIKLIETLADDVEWHLYLRKYVKNNIIQSQVFFEHECQNKYMFSCSCLF